MYGTCSTAGPVSASTRHFVSCLLSGLWDSGPSQENASPPYGPWNIVLALYNAANIILLRLLKTAARQAKSLSPSSASSRSPTSYIGPVWFVIEQYIK